MVVRIETDFHGGSAEVVETTEQGAVLRVRADEGESFRQWFSFRAYEVAGRECRFVLANAGECTYAGAFESYRVVASDDGERWVRVPTTYEDGALTFTHTPARDGVHFAYFAPYPDERQQRVLREAAALEWLSVEQLGSSLQGRALVRVVAGDPEREGARVWITARQHPGETMAQWFMEGLLERLMDGEDPVVRALLERVTLSLVVNVNPDGSALGHQRCNAAGVDLNRCWREPDERSPEVLAVRGAMEREGVRLYLDVHGDERTPYCFLAGCEGNPHYTERLRALENCFEQCLLAANADFQDEIGYDKDLPGMGDLNCASNWVGEVFQCLSYTLEMPFTDNANAPDEARGWTPERSKKLGADVLEAILATIEWESENPDEGEGEESEEGEGDEDEEDNDAESE